MNTSLYLSDSIYIFINKDLSALYFLIKCLHYELHFCATAVQVAESYSPPILCFRTLNNNNLTSLGKSMFENMFRLRTLRLSDNNLNCDCHLSWLARWLRRAPRLGLYTRCFSPNQLKGQNVADLHDQEFKCSGKGTPPSQLPICVGTGAYICPRSQR